MLTGRDLDINAIRNVPLGHFTLAKPATTESLQQVLAVRAGPGPSIDFAGAAPLLSLISRGLQSLISISKSAQLFQRRRNLRRRRSRRPKPRRRTPSFWESRIPWRFLC